MAWLVDVTKVGAEITGGIDAEFELLKLLFEISVGAIFHDFKLKWLPS